MPIKITDENYQTYKELYQVFWSHYSLLLPTQVNAGPSPIDVLNKFESKGKSFAKRSLQSGIGDLVFIAQDVPASTIQAIDNDLKAKGLPDFTSFKNNILDTRGKVLKRGKIKSIDEYYIIQEIVADMSNELKAEERERLSFCLGQFEMKSKRGG
jgi:hypothetical protein